MTTKHGPEKVFPKVRHLAFRAGCAERTASRCLSILKAAGIIQQIGRGRTSSLYRIIDFGGSVAGQAGRAEVIYIQKDNLTFGGSNGGATPYINAPSTPPTPIRPSQEAAKGPRKMQRPAYYTTPEEIRLWDLAQLYLSRNPQIAVTALDYGPLMHALEDAAIQTADQLSGFTYGLPAPKKPAASGQQLHTLRKALC